MKVAVDESRCQLTGFCARVAPEYFELQSERTVVRRPHVDPADIDTVREAEDLCPTSAVVVGPEER